MYVLQRRCLSWENELICYNNLLYGFKKTACTVDALLSQLGHK